MTLMLNRIRIFIRLRTLDVQNVKKKNIKLLAVVADRVIMPRKCKWGSIWYQNNHFFSKFVVSFVLRIELLVIL